MVVDLNTGAVTNTIKFRRGIKGIAVDTVKDIAVATGLKEINLFDINTGSILSTARECDNLFSRLKLKGCSDNFKPDDKDFEDDDDIDRDIGRFLDRYLPEIDEAIVKDLKGAGSGLSAFQADHTYGLDINQSTHIAVLSGEESLLLLDMNTNTLNEYPLDDIRHLRAVAVDRHRNISLVSYLKDRHRKRHDTGVLEVQLPNPAPEITGLTPSFATSGDPDTALRISGDKFITSSAAQISLYSLNTLFADNNTLDVLVPSALLSKACVYPVTVTNPEPSGGISNSVDFTVFNPMPFISAINPSEAMAGTQGMLVNVSGTGFTDDLTVFINGISRNYTSVSRTNLTVSLTPADLETGGYLETRVSNPPPGGGTSNAAVFTVINPAPVLASISPASVTVGDPGFTLSLTGSNFISSTSVYFNEIPVTTTYISDSRIDISISTDMTATPGNYPVKVSNAAPGGGVSGILNLTVNTASMVEPLPEGSYGKQYEDLIPNDATIERYDPKRFSIITGLIKDRTQNPLPGVTVSIKDHPEYGSKPTDGEGRFSIPAEGGGFITVVYRKTGFITSHRQVEVGWNNVANVENVIMIPEDSVATMVTFDGNPATITTHKSSATTDEFGSRSLTAVFAGDNRAFVKDENGNEVEVASFTIRATEFDTPESMPAKLPPNSAYTYCSELTVDGAKNVRFEKPVTLYVDNFLGFNVGEIVPVGYYDRDRGVWVPSDNGKVIRLLDTDSDGIADAYDATGDGNPEGTVTGLNDPAVYTPGKTYWRVELDHFTPIDCNWPFGFPPGAIAPNTTAEPNSGDNVECEDEDCINSYVERKSGIFHEDIPVAGTDMTLHYSSNRVKRYKTLVSIPASGPSVPSSLKKIIVKMNLAGRNFETVLEPLPNQKVEFIWDGLDYLGRMVNGATVADIRVGFVYNGYYYSARRDILRSFAQAGTILTGVRGRQDITSWKQSRMIIDSQKASVSGFYGEGWTLSKQHHAAMGLQILYMGDGTTDGTAIKGKIGIIEQLKSSYCMIRSGDIVVDNAGSLFIVEKYTDEIKKLDTNGILTTVTGYQDPIYDTQIKLATDNQGNIYIAYSIIGTRIDKVNIDGIVTTLTNLSYKVEGIAADNAGNIYMSTSHKILKLDTSGVINTVAGTGVSGYSGDGGPATQAKLYYPKDVEIDSTGNIYIADYSNNRIRKINTNGIITTVAGNGMPGHSGDGGPATQAKLYYSMKIAVDSTGNIYIIDWNYIIEEEEYRDRIRKVDASGTITTIAGNGTSYIGNGGPATEVMLDHMIGLTVDSEGNIYITRDYDCSMYGISFPRSAIQRSVTFGDVSFADKKGTGYIMSSTGLHKSTVDLATGKTLLTFNYDQNNNLVSITDRFGNQTTIQRDGNGVPVSITSPYGHVTSLEIGSDNKLEKVTYQDNSFYSFAYTSDGLMTDEYDPVGNHFNHRYDATGKIIKVTDPEGGNWNYTRSVDVSGDVKIDILTAEGNLTQYVDHKFSTGAYTSVKTDPSGSTVTTTGSADGLTETTQLSCGMTMTQKYDLDTEYKYKYVKENKTVSPTGLTKTIQDETYYEDTNGDEITDKIAKTVNLNGLLWTSVNNTRNGSIINTSPLERTVTFKYDRVKLLKQSMTVPGLHPVTYGYDSFGRLTSTVSGSRAAAIAYDSSSNVDHITTPDGKTVSFTYDAMGRIISKILPDNTVLNFEYDSNGNITILTNPNNIDYNFEYTGVELRKTMTMPLSGNYQYAYDKERKLKSILFPSGNQIENTYTNGLLTATSTPEGATNYSYNCTSLLAEAIEGAEKIAYTYDGSLLKADIRTGLINQAIGYNYNNDFRISSISYAGASQALAYDNDGLLISAGSFAVARNAQNGLPVSVSDGVFTNTRAFSGYGEVDGNAFSIGGNTKYSYNLTRDLAGRIVQKTESIGGATDIYDYTYDNIGRLTEVKKNSIIVETYTYDDNGNRLTDGSRAYNYSAEDHLITVGSSSYQFDADGFLIQKTSLVGTMTTDYSSRGELLSANLPNSTIITYDHDPMGRRITKRVDGGIAEKYLWKDNITLLAVYDGSDNLIMRFNYADGRLPVSMIKDGSTYFLFYDQIGTLRAVSDSSGNIVKQIDYNAFGSIIADTNPAFTVPFGFAGGLHDRNTGLVRFGYRDYDPAIGRWTAKDPIDFGGGDTNHYGYVINDPVNMIDPEGLFGVFGPGFSNINKINPQPSWAEQSKNYPSPIENNLKGNAIPGEFGTVGIAAGTEAGQAVWKGVIGPVARTVTKGTPIPIIINPNIFTPPPANAETETPSNCK